MTGNEDAMMKRLAAITALAILMSACRPKKPPAQPPPPATQEAPYTATDGSMTEVAQRSAELTQVVAQLPGRTVEDDRRLVTAAFDRASAALAQLAGPNPPGMLRQAMRILDSSREKLASLPKGAVADPTIDSGLRALYNGLAYFRETSFVGDDDVTRLMNDFAARTEELDTVRGPLHSLVVAHAFNAASSVLAKMSAAPR
jgi:hypothetical protein